MSEKRIDRRTVVKGAGAGAALVWATPAVTSMGSAFAQGTPAGPGPSDCTIGRDWTCGQVPEECAGSPDVGCFPAFPICVCDVDTEGRTFCWNNYFCDESNVCSTSDDCPGESRCVSSCCPSATTFTCAPPCGQCFPDQPRAEARAGGSSGARL